MKISILKVEDLPVAVIDNLYSKTAYDKIWQELLFLNNGDKLIETNNTGAAKDDAGNDLKKNKALWLDKIYPQRNISNILMENRVIWKEEFLNTLIEKHTFFKYFKNSNMDATLLSYYEDSDYYSPHQDTAIFSAITWFFKSPKQFEGGDFILENDCKIQVKSNRCVIFPSILLHSVDKISMPKSKKGKSLGRFAMSQFVTINN
jgi:Rps23 Pro-64 3,4-dihydroxylase Tpa1-like proline 4-hydroxylase